jgi:hypothetical protein
VRLSNLSFSNEGWENKRVSKISYNGFIITYEVALKTAIYRLLFEVVQCTICFYTDMPRTMKPGKIGLPERIYEENTKAKLMLSVGKCIFLAMTLL